MAATVEAPAVEGVDPITFEIVRHRLWAIDDEMAMTLKKTAGNPSITDAHDFMVAIFTANGDIVLGGWGGNRHVSCTAQACRGILARFKPEEIQPDDAFLLNDPYIAAIHPQDVYLLSPVHFAGELVGWVGNFTHLPDIGGIDPGTSPRATEIIQEGLLIPGLKIVDRDVLRQDVWDTLLNMTREPEMNALQLKAQLAANNTGKAKLRDLIAKVGVERYRAIVARLMDYSEQVLRARLREIPDGVWRTREYYDTADRMYKVELAMSKRADTLDFDFTGTSLQAPSFINCTYWGTRGGIFVSVSSMLGFGLPWNEGLLRPLTLTVPEGTLLNCSYPAPVSSSTIAASRVATLASWSTMASMLAMSDRFADEVSAQWSAGTSGVRISGINRDGKFFVLTPFAGAGGGGARSFADGVDTAGGQSNPMHSIPNIETLERNAPHLYLFRRHLPDSGGAGTFRGGVSTDIAFIIHKAPRGVLKFVHSGSGMEPAQAHGYFGGFPACNTGLGLYENTNIRTLMQRGAADDLTAVGGEYRKLSPQGLFELDENGVVFSRSDGGGGLGDPLNRPTEAVLRDVLGGIVSARQARHLYGVVLNESGAGVDEISTGAQRDNMRRERIDPTNTAGERASLPMLPLPFREGEDVFQQPVAVDSGVFLCRSCNHRLGPTTENWKTLASEQSEPLASLGELWNSTRFVLRSYACPGCGVLLDAEMTLPEDPPIWTYTPLASTVGTPSK